jgi:hypothetical protein
MKAAAIVVSLVLILGLFIAACSRQETTTQSTGNNEQQIIEPETETVQYINGQLVNPDETIEIGEMI